MNPYPLGRKVEHDQRSRGYQAATAQTQRSVLWGHHAPVLDQGKIGSCTGNAMAQLLNTDPFTPARTHINGQRFLDESDAVTLYHEATVLDSYPGTYPPNDTGSSGIGVAKAAKHLGYLSAYKHTFTLTHFLGALQLQPVIVGTTWHDSMFTPNRKGFVKPVGAVAGGHEYLALGVDYAGQYVTFLNSWSNQWGHGGRFFMTFQSFASLLADKGDATAPIGVT